MDRHQELEWLVSREIPHLRRYALALTQHREAADDLVQDCLERALRKRHLWRYPGNVRSWLFRILYRVFINQHTRRRRRGQSVSLQDLEQGPAEPSGHEAQLAWRDVAAALRQLPGEQRAAILLVALEGTPYDEAARILGIPLGTLRSRLSRGREGLRRLGVGIPRQEPLRRVK